MKDLAGKAAWITGGASGIGLALARRLAAEKMRLAIVDVEEGALREAEAELRGAGATVIALRADVASAADVDAAAKRARDAYGTIRVICNNAGVGGGTGPTWELSEADWKWSIDVNLWGVIHGMRALLPQLVASGEDGHVVNTASIAGLTSTPFMSPYTAAKHAVVALSECLAKELELAKKPVGVSVVCPAFVKTHIASSHRNRPAPDKPAAPPSETAAKFGTVLSQMVDAGIPAERVADAIVAAIREPRFYVLTHPEMKPQIEYRMKQILEERAPGIDPLFRSLFGG